MSIYIFIIVWIFATYPITKKINDRMVEKGDEDVYLISFQILLFIRAIFHVPTYYFRVWVNLIKKLLK
jgi:hypothetical protein